MADSDIDRCSAHVDGETHGSLHLAMETTGGLGGLSTGPSHIVSIVAESQYYRTFQSVASYSAQVFCYTAKRKEPTRFIMQLPVSLSTNGISKMFSCGAPRLFVDKTPPVNPGTTPMGDNAFSTSHDL